MIQKVHVGCGATPIEEWLNVDAVQLPGVDRVLDVREGLPFRDLRLVYAEHFLEHLTLREGHRFLTECRAALSDSGILRVSTPNLDYTWLTHYRHPSRLTESEAIIGCLEMNRAFHGWGHKFLYNRGTLRHVLMKAGFATVNLWGYGESDVPELASLERHEKSGDSPDLPHVLIAQARGRSHERPFSKELLAEYRQAIDAR